jgi:hypothetical protein
MKSAVSIHAVEINMEANIGSPILSSLEITNNELTVIKKQ